MLILGIDPGSQATGFGLVESRGDRFETVEYGLFPIDRKAPLAARLAQLHGGLGEFLNRQKPDVVALETPYSGINPKSLIVLAQARGALLAAVAARNIPLREYAPAQVKSAVTGNGRAEKQQVAHMVRLLLKLPHTDLSDDITDALAVAICACHREGYERLRTELDN